MINKNIPRPRSNVQCQKRIFRWTLVFGLWTLFGPWTLDGFGALTDNLISYWALNEASGSRADKVVASANTLSDNGTVGQSIGKVYANAGQFDSASSRFLSIGDNASVSIGGTAFTFIAWIYLDNTTGNKEIIGKDDVAVNREFSLYALSGGTGFRFESWTGSGGAGGTNVDWNASPGTGVWRMVMVKSDQTLNYISVDNGTAATVSAVNAGWNGAGAFKIGSRASDQYFSGRIGPVIFWKRALTPSEVTQVWNSGNGVTYEVMTGGPPPPVTYDLTNFISYWALDEASGNRADKVVATANTLTDNNTVNQDVGKVYANSALFIGGNTEFLSHTDNASLSLGGTSFSFVAWVYATAFPTFVAVVAKDDGAVNFEYVVYYDISANRWKFVTTTGASSAGAVTVTANNFGAISLNTWYMIAVTSDQTNNKISVNAGTQDSVSAPSAGWNGAATFTIGGTPGAYWNGRIGPVLFYKRALSAQEITDLYNSSNGVTYETMTAVGGGNTMWLTQQQRRRR